VKIISPQYVKPFVRRQKNDGNDAEAICTAARQPHIPLVPKKTVEQQDIQALHRAHQRMVNHRTAVHGASAVVRAAPSKTDHNNQWINQLPERRGFNRATVAVANKNARIIGLCFEPANRTAPLSEDPPGDCETTKK
jgi:transposase